MDGFLPELKASILKRGDGELVARYSARFARYFHLSVQKSSEILTRVECEDWQTEPCSCSLRKLSLELCGELPLSDFNVWRLTKGQKLKIERPAIQLALVFKGSVSVRLGISNKEFYYREGDLISQPSAVDGIYHCNEKESIMALALLR